MTILVFFLCQKDSGFVKKTLQAKAPEAWCKASATDQHI